MTDSFVVEHGPLERSLMVRYAYLINDFSPMHWDDDVAHAMGLPRAIAPATIPYGYLFADVGERLWSDRGPFRLPRFSSVEYRQFRSIFLGETLRCTYDADGPEVRATVEAVGPDGSARAVGAATIVVAPPGASR